MNIWEILKISPTSDIRLIKKAYAKQSRLCHPEENPEMWQKINTAYHMALQDANHMAFRQTHYGDKPEFSVDNDATPLSIRPDCCKVVQETIQEDNWFDFDAPKPPVLSLSQQETAQEDDWFDFDAPKPPVKSLSHQESESISDALQYTAALVKDEYIQNNRSEWKKLLNSQVYIEVREIPLFLNSLATLLRDKVGYLKPKIQTEIFNYFNLYNYANASDAGKYSKLFTVMQNARVMLADNNANRGKILWYKFKNYCRSILLFGIFVFISLIPILIFVLIFIL